MSEKLILEYTNELVAEKSRLEQEYNQSISLIKQENAKYQKKVGSLFYRLSTKKRNDVWAKITELQKQESELTTAYLKQTDDLESELSSVKFSPEYALSKVFEKKPELKTDEKIIIELLKYNPAYLRLVNVPMDRVIKNAYMSNRDLFADERFMESLINIDCKYIVYDMTDDDNVYKAYISSLLMHTPKDNYFYQPLIKLKEELTNPKKAQDGMYKIPHKYLYEDLRKKVYFTLYHYGDKLDKPFDIGDFIPGDMDPYKEPSNCKDYISRYLYNDCRQSKVFGEKMEALYNNRDVNLLIASCNPGNHHNIFENGYKINTQYDGDIYRNFWDVHGPSGSFLNLFKESAWGRTEVVYVAIPKDQEKFLGSDGEILKPKEENGTYVLPEYVYGVSTMENGKKQLIENNIPLDKRKKYKNRGKIRREIIEYYELRERVNDTHKENHRSR